MDYYFLWIMDFFNIEKILKNIRKFHLKSKSKRSSTLLKATNEVILHRYAFKVRNSLIQATLHANK
jgi:hypothetical protein